MNGDVTDVGAMPPRSKGLLGGGGGARPKAPFMKGADCAALEMPASR